MSRVTVSAFCLVFLWGCIVVQTQPPSGATPTQPASLPQYTPGDSPPQAKEDWKPANIAEAIAFCQRVQKAQDFPVSCGVEYLQGRPAMILGFPDAKTAGAYMPAVVDAMAVPFCQSANNANRQAFLFFVIQTANLGNMYSCENDEMSGWFNLGQK